MKKTSMRLVGTTLCIALVLTALPANAAGPAREELRKEAFLRGGDAIAAALNAKGDAAPPLAPTEAAREVPPLPRRPAPPQSGPGLSKAVWVGLIAGFAVSGALIYHYATGPGASVRNCSTCK